MMDTNGKNYQPVVCDDMAHNNWLSLESLIFRNRPLQ